MQQLKVYTQESKCTNSLLNIFPQKTYHQVLNKSVYLIKLITNPLSVQKIGVFIHFMLFSIQYHNSNAIENVPYNRLML